MSEQYRYQRTMPSASNGHPLYTRWDCLMCAEDLVISYAYHDEGLADERLNTVTHSSASLGIQAVETYYYDGGAGNYTLKSKTREVSAL